MNASVLPVAVDELRNDHGMVGRPTQRARPEFTRRQGRRIDDPRPSLITALALGEEGGRGFQGSDVGPMPQLRLGIAADHLPIATQRQPLGLLLVVAEAANVGDEHHPVQGGGDVVGDRGHEGGEVRRFGNLSVGTWFRSDAVRAT